MILAAGADATKRLLLELTRAGALLAARAARPDGLLAGAQEPESRPGPQVEPEADLAAPCREALARCLSQPEFLELVRRHKLGGLLGAMPLAPIEGPPASPPARARQATAAHVVEASLRTQLRAETAARNMLNEAVLVELERALQVAAPETRVIVLKGPAFAAYYSDPTVRASGDLDVLVKRCDVRAVVEVLRGMGFAVPTPCVRAGAASPPLGRGEEDRRLRRLMARSGEIQFVRARMPAGDTSPVQAPGVADVPDLVEVHWNLVGPQRYNRLFTFDLEGVWERSRRHRGLQCLGREDAVFFACVHMSLHHYGVLGWLVDLAAILARPEPLEWGLVVRSAARSACKVRTYWALALAQEVCGVAVPPRVLETLAPGRMQRALGRSLLRRTPFARPIPAFGFRTPLLMLALCDSPAQASRLLSSAALPGPDYVEARYPWAARRPLGRLTLPFAYLVFFADVLTGGAFRQLTRKEREAG